jgi:hypothetical protein
MLDLDLRDINEFRCIRCGKFIYNYLIIEYCESLKSTVLFCSDDCHSLFMTAPGPVLKSKKFNFKSRPVGSKRKYLNG